MKIDPIKKQRQEASQKSRAKADTRFYINDDGDGNYKVQPKQGRFCVTVYKNGSEVAV